MLLPTSFVFRRSSSEVAPDGGRRFLALDRLLRDTAYQSYYRTTSVRPGTNAPADIHNLAILSRWPISEQRQLYHDIVAKQRSALARLHL
jgi:hypothetical protein